MIAKLIEGDAKDRISAAKKESREQGAEELAKVLKELDAAFDKVAKEKTDGGKGKQTYGELLKEGKLPVDPEVAKAKYEEEQKKKKAEEG